MDCARNVAAGILAAFLLTIAGASSAQVNPLYEHRRALQLRQPEATVAISSNALSDGARGRVILSVQSSSLLDAGIRSGDPIRIELASGSILARAAFRDEVERNAKYHADASEPVAIGAGVTLVVDRYNPGAPIVIDTSAGQSTMSLAITRGESLIIRLLLSAPSGRRTG